MFGYFRESSPLFSAYSIEIKFKFKFNDIDANSSKSWVKV